MFYHRRKYSIGRAESALIPITDVISPDKYFKFVRSHLLRRITLVQQFRRHSATHAFAAGIILASYACTVHTLPDSIFADCIAVNLSGYPSLPPPEADISMDGLYFKIFIKTLPADLVIDAKSSHKIRKSFISSLFDNGLNINKIWEIAGHEDKRTSLDNYCFDTNTDKESEDILEKVNYHLKISKNAI